MCRISIVGLLGAIFLACGGRTKFVGGSGDEGPDLPAVDASGTIDGASGTDGATTARGGTIAANGCLKPGGTSIGIFNELTQQKPWTDPATRLSGTLFLDPASAGSFMTGYAGMHLKYWELQQALGGFANDPSFGVHFAQCVDASAFKGVTFRMWPTSAPAGAHGVLRVLTDSTTPAPYGHCVPKSADDCRAPYFEPTSFDFTPNSSTMITWDLLAGGSPDELGIDAATQIVGMSWVVDAWEGPPPTQFQVEFYVDAVAFVPM